MAEKFVRPSVIKSNEMSALPVTAYFNRKWDIYGSFKDGDDDRKEFFKKMFYNYTQMRRSSSFRKPRSHNTQSVNYHLYNELQKMLNAKIKKAHNDAKNRRSNPNRKTVDSTNDAKKKFFYPNLNELNFPYSKLPKNIPMRISPGVPKAHPMGIPVTHQMGIPVTHQMGIPVTYPMGKQVENPRPPNKRELNNKLLVINHHKYHEGIINPNGRVEYPRNLIGTKIKPNFIPSLKKIWKGPKTSTTFFVNGREVNGRFIMTAAPANTNKSPTILSLMNHPNFVPIFITDSGEYIAMEDMQIEDF